MEQVNIILDHLKTGTLDETYETMRVYMTCYRVLIAHDDKRAAPILQAAREELQRRAANISDQELHRSLLENVPWHREALAAWQAAQSDHERKTKGE